MKAYLSRLSLLFLLVDDFLLSTVCVGGKPEGDDQPSGTRM